MRDYKEISDKDFEEFVEKNTWLWSCKTAWLAYEKRADEDEGFYEFFAKRFFGVLRG